MNTMSMSVSVLRNTNEEPQVEVVLSDADQEIFRRLVRVFSEDDVIAASNEIVRLGEMSQADVDQYLAAELMPIRMRLLRERNGESAQDRAPEEESDLRLPRYVVVLPGNEEEGETGIRDVHNDRMLSNFVLMLDEDVQVQDDMESWREFAGALTIMGRSVPFRITAKDYSDNKSFKEALFVAGGCEVVIHCGMDELRKAVSMISRQAGTLRTRTLTTNFGWNADGTVYLTPSLRISQAGIEVLDAASELCVDLGGEPPACHLDMKKLDGEELIRVKRHIVEDLLKLSSQPVTYTLLGATAAAVLYRFAPGAGRFALWLVGLTGAGKSLPCKLFTNFFGDYPVSSGRFATWSSTPYYVQRQGYFFKDALYLADDYKPEIIRNHGQFLGILQTYADGTARGRLKSDATANVLRPIRGQMVCTGEDVPEHNASAIARSVIVRVPQQKKDIPRKMRCEAECHNYSGVMADFVRWLLSEGRLKVFTARYGELQQHYYSDIAGQQNDGRIASNLALLAASFEQFAEYLGDVWPEWREAVQAFIDKYLVEIRAEMLAEAKEQQVSEVFLRTLRELISFGYVRIDGLASQRDAEHKPVIGRVAGMRSGRLFGAAPERLEICTSLALAQVNSCLRQQGRPELKINESALLQQLREDGWLLDQNGEPLSDPKADPTFRPRIPGIGQRRVFAIGRRELLEEG